MRAGFGVVVLVAALAGWAGSVGCGDSGSEAGAPDQQPLGPNGPGSPDLPLSDFDGNVGKIPCDERNACPSKKLVCIRGFCVPPQDPCTRDDSCNFDTYCADNQCVPYESAPESRSNDPACRLVIPPGNFAPKTKCEFTSAPPGDPFPDHIEVQATPMVVRFGGSAPPSIVVPFAAWGPAPSNGDYASAYTEHLGILRVLKGTDCSLEANIGGTDLDGDGKVDWVRSSSPVAVADLDGDHLPEIVAFMGDETLMAFTRRAGSWAPLWPKKKATQPDGNTIFVSNVPAISPSTQKANWGGPSIHDLDNDGRPEVIREGWVFYGETGMLRASLPPNYGTPGITRMGQPNSPIPIGALPVLANLDGDPQIELTNGSRIWQFDGNGWSEESYYQQNISSPPGWAAVADFNPYDGTKTPEIAVAALDTLTVYTTQHTVFMNMAVAVPGLAGGSPPGGGPPTIADYDGDGLPEIGLAGRAFYTVFDPDCQATPRPGGRCNDRTHCDFAAGGACPNFILWSRATQDISSNVSGSSVFDFEADGKAEVIYADECFTRVYSGGDGHVVFSRYRSSCTWLENPIVADVDGDFRAELVVPSNTGCGPKGVGQTCSRNFDFNSQVDTQFAGLVCQKNTDCISGICDQGLCRCQATAECCAARDDAQCLDLGTKCAPPPAGTPGSGNTCRASHPRGLSGIRVYEDSADRWVRSRMIWNQHAYAVTHIGEDGTVPQTSAWANNWQSTDLNNFRQNVPGTPDATTIGDLTAQAGPFFQCDGGAAKLSVPVCNRGTAPVGAGIPVGFYVQGNKVCSTKTVGPLDIGKCEVVGCTWASPPRAGAFAADVLVVANDGGEVAQCHTGNDNGLVIDVFCPAPR